MLVNDIWSLTSLCSSVYVIASFNGSSLPTWTCSINGSPLIAVNLSQTPLPINSVEICSLANTPTVSQLSVEASGTSDGLFMFDSILYEPDASTNLDNATVLVEAFDTQIKYDSGWKQGNTGMETLVQGASMTFDFVGTLPGACISDIL